MSAVGSAFRTKILSYTAVSDLVGDRMDPDVIEQGATIPAIAYYVTNTDRASGLAGVTKFASARIRLDCFAASRDAASDISKAIRETGIDRFRGIVNNYTFCGVSFDSGDEYGEDPPTDGNQVHRYVVSFDCVLHYKEP